MSVFVIIELPNIEATDELFWASIISPIPNEFITVLGFTLTIPFSVFSLYKFKFRSYPYLILLLLFFISLSSCSKYFFSSPKLLLCFLFESVFIISLITSAEYTLPSSVFSSLSVSPIIDCNILAISIDVSSTVIGYDDKVSSSTFLI